MKRSPLNHSTTELHRFQVGNRRDDTCASYLIGDFFEEGELFLCRELIGYRPPGCLGGVAEFFLLGEVVDFEDDTVCGNWQVLALRVPVSDVRHHLIDILADLNGVGDVETPFACRLQPFVVGLAGQVVAKHIIEIGSQSSPCHLFRVLQFECTGSGVARVGEERLFLFLAFFVEGFETLPREEHFAA